MTKRHFWVPGLILLLMIVVGPGCKKKPPTVPPPPPTPTGPAGVARPTVSITANPATIERGQSSTLEWNSTGAHTLTLEPGLGRVPVRGNLTVSPYESMTYRIVAEGAGGKAEATANITVNPRPIAPTPPEPTEVDIGQSFQQTVRDIYFDYDQFDIRSDAIPSLQANAEWLRAHPNVSIVIEGHCDERGSAEYNLGLGDRRANAAKEYLVSLGIDANRLRTLSYGEERPQCTDQTEDCWQRNRRAHFVLAGR